MLGERLSQAEAPIVAGPLVRLAAERHLRDREQASRRRGHPRGWVFDEDAANYVIDFFELVLKLPDIAGPDDRPAPFLLAPAQDFLIGSVFGWKGADGYRRFREGYFEMGKGNGKTPLFAGIGLYGLTEDQELAAEIYAAGSDRHQSRVMFSYAEHMVDASPDLARRLVKTVNNIYDPKTLSFFRPFSREQGAKSGPKPHMGLLDEVHEHRNADIVNKTRAGAKGRKQPFFGEITNSGFDRTSICWQHHEHSRKILEGVLEDDQWFAYVCTLDQDEDPLKDPSTWIKANPLMGVSVTEKYLARQVQNARNIAGETNDILRLNFCVWTQSVTRYWNAAKWRACGAVVPDAALVGAPCYGGLDLGKNDDFTAFVLLWLLEDGRQVVRSWFWLPQAALDKYPHRPYEQWLRAGVLEVLEGDVMDYDVIEPLIAGLCEQWSVRQLAYDDRYAHQLRLHLEDQGIEMVKTGQGFNLNEALRRLDTVVTTRRLCHGGHPILTWMADNLVVRKGHFGEIRPDKEKSSEKIDGQVALAMAEDAAIRDADADAELNQAIAQGEGGVHA